MGENKYKGLKKGLEFHIESQDYFGTLATILSLCRQEKQEIPAELITDLVYLHEYYKIIPSDGRSLV